MQISSIFTNISRYRTEIMGYAILGVMLAHIKTVCGFPDNILTRILGLLCYSVFTGGFVFLSGMGLYSSLNRNCNIKLFYFRRIKRLIFPFWVISIPYFVFTDLYLSTNILGFIGHITTIDFWIHGNYSGMWYIALSVVLYLFYPIIHKTLGGPPPSLYWMVLLCILVIFSVCVISHLFPVYYNLTSIAFNNVLLFVLGSSTMSVILSNDSHVNGLKFSIATTIAIILLLLLNIVVNKDIWSAINYISIIIVASFFAFTSLKLGAANSIFKWLGQYSLELYVLHLLLYNFLNQINTGLSEGIHMCIGVIVALIICSPLHWFIGWLTSKIELKG